MLTCYARTYSNDFVQNNILIYYINNNEHQLLCREERDKLVFVLERNLLQDS